MNEYCDREHKINRFYTYIAETSGAIGPMSVISARNRHKSGIVIAGCIRQRSSIGSIAKSWFKGIVKP